MPIKIKSYRSKEIANYIEKIVELRITEFKKFPYLYSGNVEIEEKYLSFFAENKEGLLVTAEDDNKIVGVLTGIPLSSKVVPNAIEIFEKNKLNPNNYYYWADIIIAPEYQGRGIMKQLFHVIKQYTSTHGYKNCFMMVERKIDHPLKPKDYWDLAEFLIKINFIKTDMKVWIIWPTITTNDVVSDEKNELTFWIETGKE